VVQNRQQLLVPPQVARLPLAVPPHLEEEDCPQEARLLALK
jgi:hypothetical protein